MEITFGARELPAHGTLVAGVLGDATLTEGAEAADAATGGAVRRALAAAGRFRGKPKQMLDVLAPTEAYTRVILLGLGPAAGLTAQQWERLGGELSVKLNALGEQHASVVLDSIADMPVDAGEAAARLVHGARLRGYRFDRYKTQETPEDKPSLTGLHLAVDAPAEAEARHSRLDAVARGVHRARELQAEPANVLTPAAFAERCRELERLGVEVEVLDPEQLRDLGMGALLAVGQGSTHAPRVVTMRWNGADGPAPPLAVVGKGVCFDSGGISIKPGAGMGDMKWDMGGAGVTVGLLEALAARGAAVNVVGVIGLVENMPSATAYRPGDILTSMAGRTVEVVNTDAEGRLVLADALWYTQQTHAPETVIDLATLTGGILVALGKVTAGVFSNDDGLAQQLHNAGEGVDEAVWRLPMGESYDQELYSDVADMKHVGEGRNASSITAAQFLQRFIQPNVRWAHLDIAGVTNAQKPTSLVPKGTTGFGVRLLDRYIAETHEPA